MFCGSALEDFAPASSVALRHGWLQRCSSPSSSPHAGAKNFPGLTGHAAWGESGKGRERGGARGTLLQIYVCVCMHVHVGTIVWVYVGRRNSSTLDSFLE